DTVREASPFVVEVDVSGRKVKAAMKRADKIGARTVLVYGEEESRTGRGNLKDLGVSSQAEIMLTGEALVAALVEESSSIAD
ncbi:MAG: His/Gly/Thr/Pro-type tRNA ligase C-terminal domain-containing protein, partial [Myxococcota bacterium]